MKLPGLGGSDDVMVGVLFRPHGFPKQIPHFIVKLKASKCFQLQRSVLIAQDIRRAGQARETWVVRCKSEVAARPKEMHIGHSARAYSKVYSDWQAAEEERKKKERQREAQQQATDEARGAGKSVQQIKRVVRGDHEDDSIGDYSGTSGRGRALGRGRGRGNKRPFTALVRESGGGGGASSSAKTAVGQIAGTQAMTACVATWQTFRILSWGS